ncbi:TPA: hypothetical protein HH295_07960 [Xanthomonas vasicola pv. zeae]|uniref:protein adenylyltransferase SelO family protein n=1 Tax=Xanthomonas vasicola TaxID=56459 RepID=UPI0001CBF277|nr:protein adenylyltransferase SelO family protein [Xanthomonas vasicola]MBV6891142.1 hypothetical protein [Xanthomonas vasicola pv. vasculorum]MDO6947257.1 protein adenylyltransferase SelO family protein [Xanthomonas vasicola]MDO6959154.1 protein adenylyltransferase SelO family protein [Xanthomonas vasicola]MDO6970356.1 protein adenylyltransferase SelO family protein [Xanthomonas vasicola]TWQ09894.1 hypothetical protein FQK02_15000 [Xanthomonas vasicola]
MHIDLACLKSTPLFVSVAARRAEVKSVVWYDKAFSHRESAVDISVEKWLVNTFAFKICAPPEISHAEFLVDAYGSTGIASYGGSGRAGVINGYQVKGIGVTPFVDPDADWTHSHGSLLLQEGVRELVFSRVAAELFPFGAIESVALIELQQNITDDTGRSQRTALLVRPFELRPCHFQRALGFRPNQINLRHLDDVLRVKSCVSIAARNCPAVLSDFARRLGAQIATMYRLGWFHGGVYSSNFSVSAKLIDFGSSRFIIDREQRSYSQHGPKFGEEIQFASMLLRSWCYYWNRYAMGHNIDYSVLIRELHCGYEEQLLTYPSPTLGEVVGMYTWEYLNWRIDDLLAGPSIKFGEAVDMIIAEMVGNARKRIAGNG